MWTKRYIQYGVTTLLVTLFLGGCAGTEIIQGFKLNPKKWREDEAKIRTRAAFDFHCSENQLSMKILSTPPIPAFDDWVDQVGVSGCGHQGVYVRSATTGNFLLNAEKQ